VRSFFKDEVFQTIIPRSVKLAEAPSHGQPICLYDPESAGALAYKQLSEEVLALGP
jgi:chromosome partitioning protein